VSGSAYKSPQDVVRQIVMKEGIRGLFRGGAITIYRDSPTYGLFFAGYEKVKWELRTPRPDGSSTNTVASLLTAGSAAGVLTWAVAYPFDVVKSIIQVMPETTPRNERTIRYVVTTRYREQGWRFFFRGISIVLIRAVPVNAVTFTGVELSLDLMNHIIPDKHALAVE